MHLYLRNLKMCLAEGGLNNDCFPTLNRPRMAWEAQVPIQNYLYVHFSVDQQNAFSIPPKYCNEYPHVISLMCCDKSAPYRQQMTQRAKVGLKGPGQCPWPPLLLTTKWLLHSRKMYTCYPGLYAIMCLTGLKWQPEVSMMQLLQILPASNGQDFNLTQKINLGLKGRYFCIFYEKFTINFDPYSLRW